MNKLFFANRGKKTSNRNGTSQNLQNKTIESDKADTLYSEISIQNDKD